MDLNEHMLRKELINMREEQKSDWRKEVKADAKDLADGGDHPYVDVMPDSDALEQEVKNKKKEKKKEKEEKIEEGHKPLNIGRQESQAAKHLEHARKAAKEGGDYQKHVTRAETIKSPLKRSLDLSAQKNRKAELKRRAKGELEPQREIE